ncbi:PstC family ABC transporter permease [Shewanella marina]|uniref:PstC family ABC transporter permease n=1 Tax=Shewanella marina TaxID=487319 RepID=UPI00046EEFE1|nr:ABC transporter permease subunit [Shewanella marina]
MIALFTFERLLLLIVVSLFVVILLLFGFLGWFALPVFTHATSPVFSLIWRPELDQYGILPMVAGSIMLSILALLVALPIAIGICGFCLHSRHQRMANLVRFLVRLMASIPTVIYGLVAIFLLVPLLRETFAYGSGFSLLAALIMVVLLILPVMVLMLDSHTLPQLKQIRLSATALGFTETQIVFSVILPQAKKAIATTALLGFSRAIGDTLLPLMLAGNAPQISGNIFDSMRTLTAHIGLVIATENGSGAYNSLFAAGLLLLLSSIVVTLLIRSLEYRLSLPRIRGVNESR